jgi:hypothetical protein
MLPEGERPHYDESTRDLLALKMRPATTPSAIVIVRVDPRWRHSFEMFLFDIGAKPPGTRLERRDKSGDFCAPNCEWKPRGGLRRR